MNVDDWISARQRVFVSGSSNEPRGLLEMLRQCQLAEDLEFIQFPLPGLNQVDFTTWNATCHLTTFFMTPALRAAYDPSRVNFLPMQMRSIYEYLSTGLDVALIQVARDVEGNLRMGPNVDFSDAALSVSATVIAELNEAITAPSGSPPISRQRIDHLITTNHHLPTLVTKELDSVSLEIGRRVASLINDGDCIQTGIGAMPAAVLRHLETKNDLGLHSGLVDDACLHLIERGNINGSRKPVDTSQHIVGMAIGSKNLYRRLPYMPSIVFRGADYTHEVNVISRIPNFVSINSAVEVDLFGQVNAEMVAGEQVSGTGGSVDFMRAARVSPGGRSIIAMPATTQRGAVSRIVPKVQMVTALRTDVDIVVTEHGVANIKYLPIKARAEALIKIAAPKFRDELRAEQRKILSL